MFFCKIVQNSYQLSVGSYHVFVWAGKAGGSMKYEVRSTKSKLKTALPTRAHAG